METGESGEWEREAAGKRDVDDDWTVVLCLEKESERFKSEPPGTGMGKRDERRVADWSWMARCSRWWV